MPNYQIIKDEKSLKEFIEWLPILTSEETYYFCLFCRSKYLKDENGVNQIPHIKTDKSQVKRGVATKDRLFEKIKQLEVEEGAYRYRGEPIPQESLALYITPNPRNLWKATKESCKKLLDCIVAENKLANPHAEVMSEIQRSKSRTVWVTFDMDYRGETAGFPDYLAEQIKSKVGNRECFKLLETRGGYHILVQPQLVSTDKVKSFFKEISEMEHIDQGVSKKGEPVENMIPVPGCYQGGFVPKFI